MPIELRAVRELVRRALPQREVILHVRLCKPETILIGSVEVLPESLRQRFEEIERSQVDLALDR